GGTARLLAGKMFPRRIYTDDPRARFVVVRHRQMKKEEICPFVQGVAYPRIYTEDGVILFQDEKQRRYASTVDYNRGKLLNEREMLPRVLELGADDPGVLLHFCENAEPEAENLHIFLRLLRSDAFTSEYKRQVRQRLLDFYAAHMHDEELTSRLREMNYRDYAAVDKKTLLEILIDRGMFSQALGIVEEFGFEGVGNRELLRLTSRMIVKSDFAEDEELLALASHVYRCGLFDEVILHYLMEFRSGPMEELLSIWKSAVGFEMDTYSLEERILSLLIFTSDDRREGEQILAAYIRHAGKERIIGAYLTQIAYGIFVKENPMTPFIRDCLENAYLHKWPVNRVCRLALFKALSREKKPKGWMLDAQKEFLRECLEENMIFSFFRRLPTELLSPYQLDDKTFVEYHTSPRPRVTLVYTLDTGLGTEPQVHSEPLPNVYEGIFVKSFTLFYGEALRYYFVVEEDGSSARTSEHTLSMSHVEGSPASRYQLLNQILSARKLEKGPEVTARMKEYLRREQYVRKMFVIEKEG
ncbi:MAG: DUF5717 family protein, partial [Clostridiales bacterium]|nr:DUF5717 family protein [Clostridiales bacterium]